MRWKEGAAFLYKSLLTPEELNLLLSEEQSSELAAVTGNQGSSITEESPDKSVPADHYLHRIQQLELDMGQLLHRVYVLESQLKEYEAAEARMTSSNEQLVARVEKGLSQVRLSAESNHPEDPGRAEGQAQAEGEGSLVRVSEAERPEQLGRQRARNRVRPQVGERALDRTAPDAATVDENQTIAQGSTTIAVLEKAPVQLSRVEKHKKSLWRWFG